MSKAREKKSRRRGGFAAGALIGGLTALFATPLTGKEARERLRDALSSGGSCPLRGQVDRLRDAMGAGKESAADQSEALKCKIEETRARLRQQMDEGE